MFLRIDCSESLKCSLKVSFYFHFISAGTFFFIETSWPQKAGDNAIIYTRRVFKANQGQLCFNFWYHMYGSHIGALNIYINSEKSTPIWTKTGDQGDVWRHGRVTIGGTVNYQVSCPHLCLFGTVSKISPQFRAKKTFYGEFFISKQT